MRRRIVREQQLSDALAFEEVAATIPTALPVEEGIPLSKQCVNHPEKWAQQYHLCRECLRATGDQRTTREIQAGRARSTNVARSHRKPDLDDLDRAMDALASRLQ